MKKRFKLSIGLSLLILLCAVGYLQKREQPSNASALLFENIEALANGEDDDNYNCIGAGTVDCPNGDQVSKIIYFSLPIIE